MLNFKKAPRWVVTLCSLALVIFTVGFTTNPPQHLPTTIDVNNFINNVSVSSIQNSSEAQSNNLSIIRIGDFFVDNGDVIKTDISWKNSGTVIAMYTDKNYTDDEIFAAFQGIPGIPKVTAPVSGIFNMKMSDESPLTRKHIVTQAGTYPFYIIHAGYDVTDSLSGSIIREDVYGNKYEIWTHNESSTQLLNSQNAYNSNRKASLIADFERYNPYDVNYNAELDAVFYNGERVKLFVEFSTIKEDEINFSFELCYQDKDTDSKLYLEAVKDSNGQISEIRRLDDEIAHELLDDMNSTVSPIAGAVTNSSDIYLTMDATAILEDSGITATDKNVTKDNVPQNIKDWIIECDKQPGAYSVTNKSGDSYVTYIYYNGGGRFPWNIAADNGNDSVSIHWVSNGYLGDDDGYCLMYFTSPKEYASILIYLDSTLIKTTWLKYIHQTPAT